jgi:hypothetical protein
LRNEEVEKTLARLEEDLDMVDYHEDPTKGIRIFEYFGSCSQGEKVIELPSVLSIGKDKCLFPPTTKTLGFQIKESCEVTLCRGPQAMLVDYMIVVLVRMKGQLFM